MFFVAAIVLSLGIWWWKSRSADIPPVAKAFTEASAVNQAGAEPKPDFQKLTGRWQRPDGGTLKVDGKEVATKRMEKTLPMILQWDESLDVGSDTLTGVNDADYKPPFKLTAELNKLTVKVDRPQLSPEDIKKLRTAMQEKAKAD